MDIFFLYCIYGEGVTYNIPYWLAWYFKKDKDVICGGMFVTRIARYFRLLTNIMRDALHVEPKAHVFKKRSLIAMDVMMDLGRGACCWPTTRQVGEDVEVKEAANEGAANEEASGSAEVYQNMSRGDWQFQYLSTRDNLDPHLQIDPFPRREADYPPYGYTGHMPAGYEYQSGPAPGSFD
ncbi:hypothetical protein Tco_1076032 [Tanacetum coccineum]